MTTEPAGDAGTATAPEAARRTRVLFVTDNGHGLGHVTRLLAVARRCPPHLQPVFLTMSTSHRIIAEAGFPVEYFPSADRWGVQGPDWSALLAAKLVSVVERLRPRVLVLDHVRPARAMSVLREQFTDLALVWSRRGLWQPGRNADALDLQPTFDAVLEPLDVAIPVDAGLTSVFLDRVVHVPPITLLDPGDVLPRELARSELGLDPLRPAALVNLNADDPDELARLIDQAATVLQRWDGVQVVAPDHALHAGHLTVDDRVALRTVYPLSRYLGAFDVGVVTAGYNSFHEVVMSGLPSVFVPRRTSTIDDQQRRAEFAQLGGFGWYTPSLDDPAFEAAVDAARDPLARRRVRAAMSAVWPGNGARAAAEAIGSLAGDATPARREGRRREAARGAPPAPPVLPGRDGGERLLVVAAAADSDQVRSFLDAGGVGSPQARPTQLVLLVPGVAAADVAERGHLHETLLPASTWASMEPTGGYEDYVRARIREAIATCAPDRVVSIGER